GLSALSIPSSASGFTARSGAETTDSVLTSGLVSSMYLFPSPPAQPNSLSVGSYISIALSATPPTGSTFLQLRFTTLSDEYPMYGSYPEQYCFTPLLTVS